MKKCLIAAALLALAVMAPPLAQADADGYLNYLRDNNIARGPMPTDSTAISDGQRACNLLRAGLSVDQIAADAPMSALYGVDVRGIAIGAQQHLCPETLN